MGCTPSKEQLQLVTNASTAKLDPLSTAKTELLVATPTSSSKELTHRDASSNHESSSSMPDVTSTTSTENNSPVDPASSNTNVSATQKGERRIRKLRLDTQERQRFKRDLETSLRLRGQRHRVTKEAVSKAKQRDRKQLDTLRNVETIENHKSNLLSEAEEHHTLDFDGQLSIILTPDDAGGHSKEALNNSYGSSSMDKDDSQKKERDGAARRQRRRRSSHSTTKQSDGQRRSKSPGSVSAKDQKPIIPSNEYRLHSSGRRKFKKGTSVSSKTKNNATGKDREDAVLLATVESNDNEMDISQLGASGSSFEFNNSASTSSIGMIDGGEGTQGSHCRRQKRAAKKKKKHDEDTESQKGDIGNHIVQADTEEPKDNGAKKAKRSKNVKSLSRQSSKSSVHSVSSKQSTSSRLSSSSKMSAGSAPSKTSKTSSKKTSKNSRKKSRKKKKKDKHIPENNPRNASVESSIKIPPSTAKATTPPLPTPEPVAQGKPIQARHASEQTSRGVFGANAAQSTAPPTSKESSSTIEMVAKSMSGSRQHSGHSKIDGPSQHSLGAPSQHSLNNYLPDTMMNSSNSKGMDMHLSSAHETLEDLPEDLDESAEFAQEDDGDNDAAGPEAASEKPKHHRPSIANIVKNLHLIKKKSTFEGGQALTDSDDEEGSLVLDQNAIAKSYRKHKSGVMSTVMKQIKNLPHSKSISTKDGDDNDSERGSVRSGRESTGESVHTLDIFTPEAKKSPQLQALDPVVFEFDASDPSIAQFDPTAAATTLRSSCSDLDHVRERRSIREKRALGTCSHQTPASDKGGLAAGGTNDLKESLHSSCSQIDLLKDQLSPKRKKRQRVKPRMKDGPNNDQSVKDGGSKKVHSTTDRSKKDDSMTDGSLNKDHSMSGSTKATSLQDTSMKNVSTKGGSTRESPRAGTRQRRRLSENSHRKRLVTPANPSRRASRRRAGESPLSGDSHRSSAGGTRGGSLRGERRLPPEVPRTLDDTDS